MGTGEHGRSSSSGTEKGCGVTERWVLKRALRVLLCKFAWVGLALLSLSGIIWEMDLDTEDTDSQRLESIYEMGI